MDGAGITLEYELTWGSFVKVCNSYLKIILAAHPVVS
jgi:hypothetical protein